VKDLQWSKLKSTLESFLCKKLQGRIQIHATVYRKFHDQPGRVWITFDKQEMLSASDTAYATKHEMFYQQLLKKEDLLSIPFNKDWNEMFHSVERKELLCASDVAEEIMKVNNIFESYHLYEPFMNYSSLSIEEAINSNNVITKAFSMFDRRLGKRRLRNLRFSHDTHPLVTKFYKIRCDVEGL